MRSIFLLLLIAALALVGTAAATSENFQNGPGMIYEISAPEGVVRIGNPATVSEGPFKDTFELHYAGGVSVGLGTATTTNRYSFTHAPGTIVHPHTGGSHVEVQAQYSYYAADGSFAGGGSTLTQYRNPGPESLYNPVRVEFLRQDGEYAYYLNGVRATSMYPMEKQPMYFAAGVNMDDYNVGSNPAGIVNAIPQTWFVAKNIHDDSMSGLFDATGVMKYSSEMHVAYSIPGSPAGATLSIDGTEQTTPLDTQTVQIMDYSGAWVNTTPRGGIVTFNLTEFMAENEYGRHTVVLTTAAGTVEEEFWYQGSTTLETLIEFDRDVYAPQDEIVINTTIGTDYWLPGVYSYRGELLDGTTGEVIEGSEWAITSQTGTHTTTVTSDMFPASGEYIAALYAVSGETDILLDIDSAQIYADKVVFSGTVYNAEQGTILSGATMALTQSGTTTTQTTGSDGRFEFAGLSKDVLTSLSAAKSGYITSWSNSTPTEYKRYEIQIALSPNNPAHTGEAIFGTVRSYPLGSFVESPSVQILKDGVQVNSTTATNKGWYIFDGLDASETYTIAVQKTGFVNYSNAVVTGSGGSSLTQFDPYLIPYYDLTVNLKDAVSLQPITSLMAVSVAGQSQQTSTGSTTFSNIQLGAVTIAVVGSGYQANETSFTLTEDDEVTLYITPLAIVPTTNVPLTPTPTPALVSMTGKVYDGMSGQPITSTVVNVSAVQGAVTRSDSTDSSGSYSIPNIQNGALITVNATAPGYTHTAFSFTPAGAATYVVDLYMYRTDESTNPTITPSAGRAGAGGTVLGGPYHELIESPTVAASNGSWTGTATMTADHVWYFSDLEPSSGYNFTASADGYITQSVQATMGAAGSFTVVPIILNGVYDVTITVKDSTSYALILQPVQLTLSNGQVGNTSTGSYTFTNLEYATYVVSAASDGYTGGGISFLAYGDHTEYLYLSKTPSGPSSSIEYAIPPKHVDLIARNIFGTPLSGVNVTVQGQSTTLPDPSILDAIFGWVDDYSDADMANVTMTGVTGSDGGVSFMMTDAVRYLVTFTDPTRGISETVELMPHDTQYMFILGSMSATPAAGMPNMTLWADGAEGASPTLRGYYNDPAGTTSALFFVVERVNGTIRTEVSNQSLGAVQTASPSFAVNHTTGAMYSWGFRATTPDRGALQQWNGITLHSRLVELPIEGSAYFWVSMCLVFPFAGLFSGNNIKYGFVAFPVFCGVLWYIGWLNISGMTLGIVMVLGVLMYLAKVQVA